MESKKLITVRGTPEAFVSGIEVANIPHTLATSLPLHVVPFRGKG